VEAFATPARLSAGKAAALPIMARLKIAAAAKTDFGPDIFVAPYWFSEQRNNASGNRRVSDPNRRRDLRAKNQQNKATKIKSFRDRCQG
jgi:hypothetical protein